MTQLEVAYFAGLFDGEGSIVIAIRGDGTLSPRIQLCNNCFDVLEQLQTLWGGNFADRGGRRAKGWELTKQGLIKTFLTDLLPFLRIKKAEAILMLEFLSIDTAGGTNPKGRARRDEIAQEIRTLRPKISMEAWLSCQQSTQQ